MAKRGYWVRTIFTATVLTALWLLLSGLYKPMILGFGAASVVLVVLVVRRMDAVDGDQFAIRLKPIPFLGYMIWLLVEIAKSNWAVTKIVLSPTMPIRQHLFNVPCSQQTDLGQVIFASSITLTPGTISVETEEGHFQVHALDYSDDDMDALADMDMRVTTVDGGSHNV